MHFGSARSLRPVRVYYYDQRSNFGDVLNQRLLPALLGRPIVPASVQRAHLVAIGSLLESLLHRRGTLQLHLERRLPPIHVWGTGFIRPPAPAWLDGSEPTPPFRRRLRVHAVRGEASRRRVAEMAGMAPESIAVGDPGLLAPELLIDAPAPEKKFRLGLVPHFVDHGEDLHSRIDRSVGPVTVVNVLDEPETVIRSIASCEVVLSSALHGLVAADALSVPNARMVITSNVAGRHFKFDDYYSAYGLDDHRVVELDRERVTAPLIRSIESSHPVEASAVAARRDDLLRSLEGLRAGLGVRGGGR